MQICYVIPSLASKNKIKLMGTLLSPAHCRGAGVNHSTFCAATKTARDVIHSLLHSTVDLPDHCFLPTNILQLVTTPLPYRTAFTIILKVFVDDFCAITNASSNAHLVSFSTALNPSFHPPRSRHTKGRIQYS